MLFWGLSAILLASPLAGKTPLGFLMVMMLFYTSELTLSLAQILAFIPPRSSSKQGSGSVSQNRSEGGSATKPSVSNYSQSSIPATELSVIGE